MISKIFCGAEETPKLYFAIYEYKHQSGLYRVIDKNILYLICNGKKVFICICQTV
jgi:hypothetical protein